MPGGGRRSSSSWSSTRNRVAANHEDPPDYPGPPSDLESGNPRDPPPPFHQATADIKDAPGHEKISESCDCDCDCKPLYGCCRQHNSIRVSAARSLTPIHKLMTYNLTFENLACMRRQLAGSGSTAPQFIPALSWGNDGESVNGTGYRMLSEVFYHDGTFLQRQWFRCTFHGSDARESLPERFFGCPHQSLSISKPSWNKRSSMVEAELEITTNPPRCASHPKQKWNSCNGPYGHITPCTRCHSDAEFSLRMASAYLYVEYACYRDLGAAMDPDDPKWRSLLTSEVGTTRSGQEVDLFKRVWRVAYRLRRPMMENHSFKYKTPTGMLDMSTVSRDL